MIRYNLVCAKGHAFESWFANSAAYDKQARRGLLECPACGSTNAENVGQKFPEEARKMHYGEKKHRSIYGTASPDDAKALHEEGIEFAPLPVLPDERN